MDFIHINSDITMAKGKARGKKAPPAPPPKIPDEMPSESEDDMGDYVALSGGKKGKSKDSDDSDEEVFDLGIGLEDDDEEEDEDEDEEEMSRTPGRPPATTPTVSDATQEKKKSQYTEKKKTCTQRMERANGRNATALDKKVNTLLQDMYKDFEARWGDGNRLLIDSSGPRQQPRGYSKVHALAMACNPKTNDLPFVTAQDRDRIWAWVQEEVEKILIEWGPRALPGHKRRRNEGPQGGEQQQQPRQRQRSSVIPSHSPTCPVARLRTVPSEPAAPSCASGDGLAMSRRRSGRRVRRTGGRR